MGFNCPASQLGSRSGGCVQGGGPPSPGRVLAGRREEPVAACLAPSGSGAQAVLPGGGGGGGEYLPSVVLAKYWGRARARGREQHRCRAPRPLSCSPRTERPCLPPPVQPAPLACLPAGPALPARRPRPPCPPALACHTPLFHPRAPRAGEPRLRDPPAVRARHRSSRAWRVRTPCVAALPLGFARDAGRDGGSFAAPVSAADVTEAGMDRPSDTCGGRSAARRRP